MMKKTILLTATLIVAGISFGQCDHTNTYVNPTCYAFTDGSVTINATGGSGSYTYLIENESGTAVNLGNVANNLPEGWYYTFIDDGAGCTDEDSVFLDDPDGMDPEIVITNPSFPGACDGVAECDTVFGYTGDFYSIYYAWTPPGPMGTGETVWNSVCAGSYGLLLNDENGCAATEDFDIGSLVGIDVTENKIEVFSSTLSKTVIVQNDFASQPLGFNIFNMGGQQIEGFELNAGKNELSVSSLSGMYVYTISQDGKTIKSGKLTF